jgi:alcohol dehydrogenase class IV
MKPFSISGMPRIVFGRDTFGTLPRIIRDYGRKVLVVTGGSSFSSSGKMDDLTAFFSQSKISVQHLSISGEPSPSEIDRAVKEYRRTPVNAVIAIGGGSVIDAGKAVAAMLAEEGSVLDFLEGIGTKKLSGVKAPFIAVPTTSGTGSEATKNAVLTVVGSDGFKKSLRHDNYIPDVALIDPSLMVSCPPSLTAACGMDTLSQLIESYISKGASPFTDALAESGLEAFSAGFLPSFTDGADLGAREKMAYASLMSGICLSHAGLGTVHGIAGPLGSQVAIPHGIACGTILGEVMAEFIVRSGEWDDVLRQKMIRIGQLLDVSNNQSDAEYIERIISTINGFLSRTGIPKLSIFGIGEEHLTRIVAGADNKASPVVLDQDSMLAVIRRRI